MRAVMVFAVTLVATSCAGSAGVEESETAAASSTTPPTPPDTSLAIAAGTTSTVPPRASTTSSTTTSTTLPTTTTTTTAPASTSSAPSATTAAPGHGGVPYDGPGPSLGDRVAVVGVAFDDSLNVRSGPGVGFKVVAVLDPEANDIAVSGDAVLLPSSIWYGVDADGVTGWVNSSYIALVGATQDATSELVALHGSIPAADTMRELGAVVAEYFVSEEPGSRIVLTVAPSVGDLGEVVYDVVGLADDAVMGYRLRVFGQQQQGSGPFSLHSVERTSLCWRGVTDDGRCV